MKETWYIKKLHRDQYYMQKQWQDLKWNSWQWRTYYGSKEEAWKDAKENLAGEQIEILSYIQVDNKVI